MSLGAPHRHRGGDIPQRAGVLDAITDRLVLGKPADCGPRVASDTSRSEGSVVE
jgi:hypothetical protein